MEAPRRVFITGALGFIGRALAARYREAGAEVAGVDVRADPRAGVVAGDVARPGPWQEAAAGADVVVNTAAIVSMTADGTGFWETNVLGARYALDAAVAAGARRFVHLSSIVAFGFDVPRDVDERHPVRPNGVPYVDTKVASEAAVLAAHAAGEIPCTVVRPGDVYGPGSRPWTLTPVEEIRAGRLLLPAMGRGLIAPVHVDDLVGGIVLAAGAPKGAGQVFTLASGEAIEAREFFRPYAEALGRRVRGAPTAVVKGIAAAVQAAGAARRLGRAPRPSDLEVTPAAVEYLARSGSYSIAKARTMLGYEPALDFERGMAQTVAWLRAEGLVQ